MSEDRPVYKEEYAKLGVTPRELYMRQNKLCWLCPETGPDGKAVVYCTDNKDKAKTANMLNPTIECVRCMVGFMAAAMEHEIGKDKP